MRQFQTQTEGLLLNHGIGDKFRLIKPALPQLGCVQRNRDNQRQMIHVEIWRQVGHRFGKHASKDRGRRAHMLVLEQVDQLAQAAIIGSISRGLFKRRPLSETLSAERLLDPAEQSLAAEQASSAGNRLNGIETF